jgi:hypothetical protein
LSSASSARPDTDPLPSSTRRYSAAAQTWFRRESVVSQNRCSNTPRAEPMIRSIRPGGSIRSARQRTSTASRSCGSRSSIGQIGQPCGELVLIAAGELAEPECRPDLLPVVLDRSSRPRVRRDRRRWDLDLAGDVLHRAGRKLINVPRGPGLDLEELQRQREAQPGRAGLVAQQRPVRAEQGPRRDQLLRRPLAAHGAGRRGHLPRSASGPVTLHFGSASGVPGLHW